MSTAVLVIVAASVVTPILVMVLVLVLVRTMMKRAGSGLPAALGSAVGGGMAQPTQGTMHVVACSVIERHAMIAPCTIAYAIEAPGIPAFSGQGTFYAQTARWPQPGTNLPVVFDAAKPGARRHRLVARAPAPRHGGRRRAAAGRPAQPARDAAPAHRPAGRVAGSLPHTTRSVSANSEA